MFNYKPATSHTLLEIFKVPFAQTPKLAVRNVLRNIHELIHTGISAYG